MAKISAYDAKLLKIVIIGTRTQESPHVQGHRIKDDVWCCMNTYTTYMGM
jgi:hypothetical protein